MIVVDASTHCNHVQVIKCDFKLGSVERSIHHWSLGGFFKHEAHLFYH
jgi:hypothetical protein